MTNATNSNESHTPAQELDARAKVDAASACLQDARNEAASLESIQEVVTNVLGSEELAVFRTGEEKGVFWLYWCVGIDPDRYVYLDVAHDPILERVMAGEIIFSDSNQKLLSIHDPVSALVPIFVDRAVAAVLVIFRLLPQKTALDAIDHEVCQVLSKCASRAIQPSAHLRDANGREQTQ